jgi:hypothetical protein
MKIGDKVTFLGCSTHQINWGGCDDPNPILEEGCTYVVESFEVHSRHTKITLVGYKGRFNSVCFINND